MQNQNGTDESSGADKPRVKIYIDGPNFYHGLQTIGKKFREFQFNFAGMGRSLTTKNRNLVGINYYSSPFNQQRNPRTYREQQKFFARLRNEGIKLTLCKLEFRVVNRDAHIQQSKGTIKGDDVAITVDMLSDAYDDVYDVGILVSSDGDFVPLVKKVLSLGKSVEILYFEKLQSWELIGCCDNCRVVSKSLIRRNFIPKYVD